MAKVCSWKFLPSCMQDALGSCMSSPCANEGWCLDIVASDGASDFLCVCTDQWTGRDCTTPGEIISSNRSVYGVADVPSWGQPASLLRFFKGRKNTFFPEKYHIPLTIIIGTNQSISAILSFQPVPSSGLSGEFGASAAVLVTKDGGPGTVHAWETDNPPALSTVSEATWILRLV